MPNVDVRATIEARNNKSAPKLPPTGISAALQPVISVSMATAHQGLLMTKEAYRTASGRELLYNYGYYSATCTVVIFTSSSDRRLC